MHTLWLFFTWPAGAVWGNVFAMPVTGIVAAVAAFLGRDWIGRAVGNWHRRHFGHHAELDGIKARLDTHADLLDLDTPGGLAAVMSELRDTKDAAESAAAEVRALAKVVAPTPMKRTASGRFAPRNSSEEKKP